MRFSYTIKVLALPLLFFGATPASAAPQLAFTFDDLPAHSTLPPGQTRVDVARLTIAALRQARVPAVYGFMNGAQLAREPESAPVLKLWRAAGFPLGNHTWSHINLSQNTVEDFTADVLRDEPLLEETMGGADRHWFRYPYLAEGDSPGKRVVVRTFLLVRGYKIAPATMMFGDWLYSEPYARCVAKGDKAAIADMKRDYFAAAEEGIGYYRSLSQQLYGRDIPYVLLMHIGAFEAKTLPALIRLYRAKGFQFVTLAQAESDPYYRQYTDLNSPPGPTSLEAEMVARGLKPPERTNYAPRLNAMCR